MLITIGPVAPIFDPKYETSVVDEVTPAVVE